MREHQKVNSSLELPGPLSGPWNPAVRDFALSALNFLRPLPMKILDPPLILIILSFHRMKKIKLESPCQMMLVIFIIIILTISY